MDSANARDAGLRRRSSDGDKPDRCGACSACDRAPAGLAEDIQAGRRAGPRRSCVCQAGGRARLGRRWGGSDTRLSTTCAGASPYRWRRHGTGPGPTRSNAHVATAVDWARSWLTPDQQQWRLRAVQDRRTHVEQSVRSAACDLDLTTERRGSPHTLVANKNQASYERRAKQRRQDLEHVSALGG